jgi:hypothetical protein
MTKLTNARWPNVICWAVRTSDGICWLRCSRKRADEFWTVEDVFYPRHNTDGDLAKFLESVKGVNSTVNMFAFSLWNLAQTTELLDPFERLGYELTQATACAKPCVFVYRRPRSEGPSKLPTWVVLGDIEDIMPAQTLAALAAELKKSPHGIVGGVEFSEVLEFVNRVLVTLHWLEYELGKSQLKPTASGIGMSFFRACHYENGDMWPIKELDLFWELKRSVYGATVDVRKVGRIPGKWYQIDCNNMYHYLAHERPLPGKLVLVLNHPLAGVASRLIHRQTCVAWCTVRATEYPYLYAKEDNPQGIDLNNLNAWLCGDELKLALDRGELVKVHKLYVFVDCPAVHRYAADCLWRLAQCKATHPKANYWLLKRVLTSTYGKFSQSQWKLVPLENEVPVQWMGRIREQHDNPLRPVVVSIQGRAYALEQGYPAYYSMPPLFGCLTAAGRVYMWEKLRNMPENSWVYMDTDSVICNEDGLRWFKEQGLLGDKAGKFSVKAEGEELIIQAPKWYSIGERAVRSGVPLERAWPGHIPTDVENGNISSPDVPSVVFVTPKQSTASTPQAS